MPNTYNITISELLSDNSKYWKAKDKGKNTDECTEVKQEMYEDETQRKSTNGSVVLKLEEVNDYLKCVMEETVDVHDKKIKVEPEGNDFRESDVGVKQIDMKQECGEVEIEEHGIKIKSEMEVSDDCEMNGDSLHHTQVLDFIK